MVDVQIGQQYSGGTRVNFPSLGVSFVVPDEWTGQIPPGAEAFVMGSNTRQGLVIAVSHQASQLSDLAQEFQQPVPLDQGVVLRLQQPAQVSGSQMSALISVSDGINNLPGYLIALARDGGGHRQCRSRHERKIRRNEIPRWTSRGRNPRVSVS